jgi:hypothetical protein
MQLEGKTRKVDRGPWKELPKGPNERLEARGESAPRPIDERPE